jgi:dTDP-4-dehydrorhamnose reductase
VAVLVFGASGFLGRELCSYFESQNETVLGTYLTNKQPGLTHFDLKSPDLSVFGKDIERVQFAICCATSPMDRCKTEWELTYKVHVEGTIALLHQLQVAGILPVFVSTDYVYDGTRGNYSEDDERSPVLAYGMQKKEVEDFLLGSGRPFIIVRLGRMYSLRERDKTVLTAIARDLRLGHDVRLAADQIFNPSHVHDICRAMDLTMRRELLGCYNICADAAISRFQLGRLIQSTLGIETGRVIACALADFAFEDNRPLNTSLTNKRFVNASGFEFTTLEESLERMKQANG